MNNRNSGTEISSNGPQAAIAAMEQEAISRYFTGVSNDPAQVLSDLQDRSLAEGETCNDHVTLVEHQRVVAYHKAVNHPFFEHWRHYEPLGDRSHTRSETLALTHGRSVTRGNVAHRKHGQSHEGLRIR